MKDKVEKIIREAGSILMSHFGKTTNGRDKEHKGDVESAADLAVEQCVVGGLQESFPGDAILTEEHQTEYLSGKAVRDAGKERLWIIDSIDGSRNFVRGVPSFGISVAYIEKDEPRLGMIYLPKQEELFWALSGEGAFVNSNTPVHVCSEEDLSHLFFARGMVQRRTSPEIRGTVDALFEKHEMWHMNLGSAVQHACYTAAGKYDALIMGGLWHWDLAAAGLILKEAGAKVTDFEGKSWHWSSDPQNMIAANPVLHAKIMKEIIGG